MKVSRRVALAAILLGSAIPLGWMTAVDLLGRAGIVAMVVAGLATALATMLLGAEVAHHLSPKPDASTAQLVSEPETVQQVVADESEPTPKPKPRSASRKLVPRLSPDTVKLLEELGAKYDTATTDDIRRAVIRANYRDNLDPAFFLRGRDGEHIQVMLR